MLWWENSERLGSLPNNIQLIESRTGIGFRDCQTPETFALPLSLPVYTKTKHPISSLALLKVPLHFSADEKTKCEYNSNGKNYSRERQSWNGGCVCLGRRESTASLPSHRDENDLGYQLLSLFTSQNWVRYSSSENSLFSAPAVIWATQLGGGLQLASWAQSSRSPQLSKQHVLASPSREERAGKRSKEEGEKEEVAGEREGHSYFWWSNWLSC